MLYLEAKNRLKDLFVNTPDCIKYGNYMLSSKENSNYYIDSKLITFNHYGATLIAECISHIAKADCVGGMELGALPIVSACVYKGICQNGFVVRKTEKQHGTQKRIEGHLPYGKVLMVDDVTTTGKSLETAIDVVRQLGHDVVAAVTVVNRGSLEFVAGVPLFHVLDAKEIMQNV